MTDDSTTWWAPAPRSLRNPALTPNDRSVFLALAWRMNWDTRSCFPSLPTIAEDANVSLAATKRSLKNLEDHGYLTRTRRRTDRGDYTSTKYTLTLEGSAHTEPRVGSHRATN